MEDTNKYTEPCDTEILWSYEKRRQDKEVWEACSKKYFGLAYLPHLPSPDPSYHSQISSFLYTPFRRSIIKSFAVRTNKFTQNRCRLHLLQTLYSLRGLRGLQEL